MVARAHSNPRVLQLLLNPNAAAYPVPIAVQSLAAVLLFHFTSSKRCTVTPYFTAVLTFMFVLVIGGLMFQGFDSAQRIAAVVIVSFSAAPGAYVLTPKGNNNEQ